MLDGGLSLVVRLNIIVDVTEVARRINSTEWTAWTIQEVTSEAVDLGVRSH